jgi:acetylornithine deacetylase/succinyl-diaminopimelate desuccinylase-like protein
MRKVLLWIPGLLLGLGLASATGADGVGARELQMHATAHYDRNYRAILDEFEQLLAIPNHASNRGDIDRNLVLLESLLGKRGLKTRRLEVPGASPALYAEGEQRANRPTILFYAHYDGQPVGSGWKTNPFEPVLDKGATQAPLRAALVEMKDKPDDAWRIYARSAGDDKAPIIAMLTALDALSAQKVPLAVNLKVFLDGEEEVGSPYLARIVRENSALIAADLLLFADGPRHQSGRPQLVLGVRGVQGAQITLFGAARTLHSGHYGNWSPNPAARLAHLLAGMRAPDGRVLIDGFDEAVDKSLAESGTVTDHALETGLLEQLRIGRREAGDRTLSQAVGVPALNVVGLQSGDTGVNARNAIPTEASASLDFRLVPNLTPGIVRHLVERHLQAQGYRVVRTREEVEAARDRDRIALMSWGNSGYSGARYREDAPPVRALISLLRELHGDKLVIAPILGGSLPLSLFAENSPVSAVVVLPIANFDNNQHAPNENLSLESLRYGIETFAAILGGVKIPQR